jgi:hypothetical protein
MSESERARLEREYVEAGNDLSLLEATLRMTPDERVRAHERALAAALAMRESVEEYRARTREPGPPPERKRR